MKMMDSETALTSETFPQLRKLLGNMPFELERCLADLSADQLRSKPSPEEFSLLESICHLRDIEVEGYSVRIDRLLAEEEPALGDLDGGRMAIERDYNRQEAGEAFASFSRARQKNIERLEGLQLFELQRAGTLAGFGVITLEKLLWLMREHDESHLAEMKNLRRSLRLVNGDR